MREILFRAWRENEMTYCPVITGGGAAFWDERDFEDCRSSDLILMQYTGLKDKNGRKIFEGDIVKCVALRDDHGQRGAIDFQQIVISMGNSCLTFRGSDNGTPIYPFIVTHEIEVIGNIYENPELLATQEETA